MKKILILQGGAGKLAEAVEDYFLLHGINCIRTTAHDIIPRIEKNDIALIALAGYMQIVPPSIHETFLTFNCHPTLLPCGKGLYGKKAIKFSFENNCSGITIHKVSEKLDSGKIIYQESVRKQSFDLLFDAIKQLERKIYPQVLYKLYQQITQTEP